MKCTSLGNGEGAAPAQKRAKRVARLFRQDWSLPSTARVSAVEHATLLVGLVSAMLLVGLVTAQALMHILNAKCFFLGGGVETSAPTPLARLPAGMVLPRCASKYWLPSSCSSFVRPMFEAGGVVEPPPGAHQYASNFVFFGHAWWHRPVSWLTHFWATRSLGLRRRAN